MNICNLAIIALVSSSSSSGVSAFTNRNAAAAGLRAPAAVSVSAFSSKKTPSNVLALPMIYPGSQNADIVAFTTTIHREEVHLDSLSIPQLKQMQFELETINNRCTEEGTQTNSECDVELKDERDYAILQIQRIVNERTGKNSRLKYVDMEAVREMAATPWKHPLKTIRQQIQSMETLNCECTEDGNQTDPVCDVQLKDERDAAIETLSLYMKSVERMLETEGILARNQQEEEAAAAQDRAERSLNKNPPPIEICRDARAEGPQDEVPVVVFDTGEIRDCIDHPGSKSLVEMQSMLAQLEAEQEACTEECTQTNPECDVEVKAERDSLMESLVTMIHDARTCMDQIKAFAEIGDEVAVEEVMEAVINTIPNLPEPVHKKLPAPSSTYQGPTDEFLVQI